MKLKLLAIASVSLLWMACITEDNKTPKGPFEPGLTGEKPDPATLTSIHWIDSVKEMGSVAEGDQVEVMFRFVNTGTKPLVISDAKPSCGCTVPEKPEDPIMPGQQGRIKAIFNSQGRLGSNHKTITVLSNTQPGTDRLEFNVNVIGKADGPKAVTAAPKTF